MKALLATLPLALLCASVRAEDAAPTGQWSVLARNYFLDSDFRSPHPSGQSYRREWAQGFIGELQSGLTPGTVGFGVDLHGFLGVKLDGGRGHAGTGLLPQDSDGRSEGQYSDAGAALKVAVGNTLLRYGEMMVETPVFDTADKRLQPEYATGWLLESQLAPGIRAQAGRFTAFKNQASSSGHGDFDGYSASTRHGGISLAGLNWEAPDKAWGGALFGSQLDDTWRQAYTNLHTQQGRWGLDANLYKTQDHGRAAAGPIDTLAWSLLGSVALNAHRLSLSYQKVDGDTPFDFVGGDSIYLANSVKYADFNGAHERSWQARYQWQAAALGLPGFSLSARYVRGSGIDATGAQAGKHWERDLDLRYLVQSGPARDLTISLAQVSHRANAAQGGDDIDRVYLIVEYPLGGGVF